MTINRRDFLRQSFAFSALASGLGNSPAFAGMPAAALKLDPKAKNILMVGDWGRQDDIAGQTATAQQMVSYAKANHIKPEALFMLGDSWYGPLPGGVDDPRWKTQFEDMYPKSAFDCPAYSIMGNHDYQKMAGVTKTTMELEYAKKPGTRWTQPSLWYTFQLPQKNPLITVIALDSNMPMGHKDNGVDFTLTPDQRVEQLAWFTAELEKPRTTPFLVVLGHHPIFSDGPHGDHKMLIADWEPLLRKHKVDLYLAGHDHDLQHLEFEGHPTSFVCSGAGGAELYDLKIPMSQRGPYAEKVYGFTHLETTPEQMTIRHIAADGRVVHAFTKRKDGTVKVLV